MAQRSTKAMVPWDAGTELVGITLTLRPQQDLQVPTNISTQLHSWFLDQVRRSDPVLSAYLHDGQSEKAFAMSGLEGDPIQAGQMLALQAAQSYRWTVTGLNAAVCDWLRQWVRELPPEMTLRSRGFQAAFAIVQWEIGLSPIAYEAVWDQFETGEDLDLSLTFLTATSFRKRQLHMPLPIPENVFHSYLRRWNDFASITVEPDDFLQWVTECVMIVRHELRSRKVQAGKQGSVTGFVGRVQFGLTPKAKDEPEYVQMVRSLVVCAPYFGTGHKVTFGLGQTRLGWLEAPLGEAPAEREPTGVKPTGVKPAQVKPMEAQKQELIEARRLELKALFFGLKKRQGGERAEKAADLWATIVARQEFGDSMKAIALDLELPYDSVKKYSQLARKQMSE
jgi:CRISPR-associated endoribonuclease Cas6